MIQMQVDASSYSAHQILHSVSTNGRRIGTSPPVAVVKILAGSAAVAGVPQPPYIPLPHPPLRDPSRHIPANRFSVAHKALDPSNPSSGAKARRSLDAGCYLGWT